nr:phage terminase large subunit [Endozoicomonas sp. SESOKO1]
MEAQLKKSFPLFLAAIWHYINLPKPTDVQKDIANYLQTGSKRMVIEAFRGVGKSFVTSAFVLWLLYRDRELKIMVVSASKDRALAFSHFTKKLIAEVPFLQHLQPSSDQRNSVEYFDVGGCKSDQSPSVKSVGITGQLTGSRADVIIADDIEVLNNSATQTARDKLSELVKEFDAILKPLPTSRIIYLGTPQTEMSIYNQLPERGYDVRIWPALYPTDSELIAYGSKIAPYILDRRTDDNIGLTTDPQRFSDDDLAERKLSYGKAGFALQFMLNTSLSDAEKYPLKTSDLMVMDVPRQKAPVLLEYGSSYDQVIQDLPSVGLAGDRFYRPMFIDPERAEYTGRVMAIDPSGKGKDETAYAVGFMLNGNIFVPDAGGVKGVGYSDEVLVTLCNIAKKHQVNAIVIEENFGSGMFSELFKKHLHRIYPCMVIDERVSSMKEKRIIDTLEPVIDQHRLIFDRSVIEKDMRDNEYRMEYSLFYQMTRITAERGALRHDDRLDALSLMVSYWVKQMAADDRAKAEEWRTAQLEAEFENFMTGIVGFKEERTDNSWLHLGSGSFG